MYATVDCFKEHTELKYSGHSGLSASGRGLLSFVRCFFEGPDFASFVFRFPAVLFDAPDDMMAADGVELDRQLPRSHLAVLSPATKNAPHTRLAGTNTPSVRRPKSKDDRTAHLA